MTTAVAIATSASAPRPPLWAMRSTAAASDSGRRFSGFVLSIKSESSDLSVQWRGAQIIDLTRGNGRAVISPGGADVGDDRGHLVVREPLCERWHPIGKRVGRGARRKATVQHHADRIHCGLHLDGLIVGQRRVTGWIAGALRPVTARALLRVDRRAERPQQATLSNGYVGDLRTQFRVLADTLEVNCHGANVCIGQVLQAVVDDFRHRAVDRPARRDTFVQVVRDIIETPIPEARLLVGRERRRIPFLQGYEPTLESLGRGAAAQLVDGRMAHPAMPKTLYQVSAAVPFPRLGAVRLIRTFGEE